jgi:metal-dependent amidase/aminoacylase/carboxypeptidase family protein
MLPSLEAAVGAGNVVDPGLITGAEDFSFFAREVPGMYFFVGATPQGTDPRTAPSNHSPEFYLDEGSLDVGFRAMLQVVMDYLERPGT